MFNFLKSKNYLLALSILLSCFSVNAYANPTSANLRFDYRTNGSFYVDVSFDRPTTTRCIARHRSSLYYEGQVLGDSGVIRKSTHSRALRVGRTSTSLRAFRLPGVKKKNGKDPIIAVQVRINCNGQEDINSNIEARYIICGDNAKRVSLESFLNKLKNEVKFTK